MNVPVREPVESGDRRLCEMLATLYDAPPGTAEATIGLLPFDVRKALVGHALIEPVPVDGPAAAEIRITERGWTTIAECARAADRRQHAAPVRRGVPTPC